MAEALPGLTMDMWTEILARLPVKSLMRLRCVCKSWCSLIDSSYFSLLHLQIYNNKPKYAIAMNCDKTAVYSIDTFRKIDEIFKTPFNCEVICCKYGLILMCAFYAITPDEVDEDEMVFHNPCTRKSWSIPRCPYMTWTCWLGFAPSTNDYKVVAFVYDNSSIVVYSSNANLWRIKDRSDAHVRGLLSFEDADEFYCKGALCWLGFEKDKPPGVHNHLVSFDFDSEEFVFVDLPDALKQPGLVKINFVLSESVAIFAMSSHSACIWVLVEDGVDKIKSWRLWYTGDSNSKAHRFLTRGFRTVIFNVEKNTFILSFRSNIFSYNFRSHRIQHLEDYYYSYFGIYMESLVVHNRNQRKILTYHNVNGEESTELVRV
ncbi:F-box/LRR-repeat/kelch-repeat protein At2g27520-like [Chenopodium quinoa]|uniref:F-box/LRR-repeat/kelch-repeat protein At2g27520-like n=1 Tax=Chenopodium quinoa TaxID=63459 RepID=UPI000B77DC34|nr:F-box/LRR-repeat/kelch-repeat protein At2g27520-like [Chenopodium quinoa]